MIYNYLISDYANRENYRYSPSTHKKSELKKIYCDIVKLSKDSPSYIVNPSKETQAFAIQLKEGALSLQDTLKHLQNGGISSAFSYKEVHSDHPEAISAFIDTEDHSRLPEPFTMEVKKLATRQVNTGQYVYNTTTRLKEGVYSFAIDIEDDTFEFQLELHGQTQNATMLSHIASTINRSSAPITASVTTDHSGDKSRLVIQSDDTGSVNGAPIFRCRDISYPKNSVGCVEHFQLNHISQSPENSALIINDEEKSTIANEFTLNNSLRIKMNQVTEAPVHIDFKCNSQKIMTQIDSISKSYNELVFMSYNQGDPPQLATIMLRDLKGLFQHNRAPLQQCGITFSAEGYMQIDEEVASSSARAGKFQEIFNSHNTDNALTIKNANMLSLDPMKYIQNKIMVNYPNPQKEHFANPYMTSIYSGMLFNSYC